MPNFSPPASAGKGVIQLLRLLPRIGCHSAHRCCSDPRRTNNIKLLHFSAWTGTRNSCKNSRNLPATNPRATDTTISRTTSDFFRQLLRFRLVSFATIFPLTIFATNSPELCRVFTLVTLVVNKVRKPRFSLVGRATRKIRNAEKSEKLNSRRNAQNTN